MIIKIIKKNEGNLKKIEDDITIKPQSSSTPEAAQNQSNKTSDLEDESLKITKDFLKQENSPSNANDVEDAEFSTIEIREETIDESEIEKYEIKQLFLNDFNEWSDKEKVEFAVEVLIDQIEMLTLSEIDSVGIIPINPFLFRPLLDVLVTDPEEEEFVSRFNKKEMMREIAQTIFETYKNKNYFVRLT